MSRGGLGLLSEIARVGRLERELRTALEPWRRLRAVHDPGRVLTQLAYALALGGDCLADIGMLRDAEPIVGPVASDPTVSRVIDDLAAGGQPVLDAIAAAHATVRARVHAADGGPTQDGLVALDVDATLITAHSEKQGRPPDLQARVRSPPGPGVPRPRRRPHRRSAGRAVATRQRQRQQRR